MPFVVSLCLIPNVSMQFGRKLTMIECEMILEDYGSKIKRRETRIRGGVNFFQRARSKFISSKLAISNTKCR